MKGEALWPFALEVYSRPGVEPLLLELQDTHGQCIPYLLWRLWMSANGRAADAETLEALAGLARAWQEMAVEPLRDLRRRLKPAAAPSSSAENLREGVKRLELDAERMLLQMLEDASPAEPAPAGDAAADLADAAKAWGGTASAPLLASLAELCA